METGQASSGLCASGWVSGTPGTPGGLASGCVMGGANRGYGAGGGRAGRGLDAYINIIFGISQKIFFSLWTLRLSVTSYTPQYTPVGPIPGYSGSTYRIACPSGTTISPNASAAARVRNLRERQSSKIRGSSSRLSALLFEREPSMTARSAAEATTNLRLLRVATGCNEMHDDPLDSRIMWSPPLSK